MSYSFNVGFEPGKAREVQQVVEEFGGRISPFWNIKDNQIWCTIQGITHEDLVLLKLRFKISKMYQLVGTDSDD